MRNQGITVREGICPIISIIMAAYNEERFIGRSIESLQSQTFVSWELIVIDDGSIDNTTNIVRYYALKDKRIRLIENKINQGLPASLNIGIREAGAELIARADADDINLPQRLEKQYLFMCENPNVDVLGTGAWLLDKNNQRISVACLPLTHHELKQLPFLKTHFFHPSVIARRRFFEGIGFYDSRYLRAQDKELWLRGIEAGNIYANLPDPLIEYSTNDYSKSWNVIINNFRSLMRMSRERKVKLGVSYSFIYLLLAVSVKFKIRKPKSLR
jgi:glycosyltransferase involved in cell wall biosynthesis